MKLLFCAFNKYETRFFQKIAPHLDAQSKLIIINKTHAISRASYTALKKANLTHCLDFKIHFLEASHTKNLSKTVLWFYTLRYKLTTKYLFLKYHTAFSKEDYDFFFIWSGLTYRQAIASEAAKSLGIKPIYIENGLLPNTIVMDKKGVNFANSLPRDPNFYKTYVPPKEPLPKKLTPRAPKDSHKFAQEKTSLPPKYIFIPFQVDYDTQLIINSPWIKDMRTLFHTFEKLLEYVVDKKLHIVFKEHPSSLINYPDLHQKAKRYSNLHIINNLPTQTLIEQAEAVITINSTVGIESLLLGKKVVVLGNAFYNIPKITKKAQTPHELIDVINQLSSWKPDVTLREKFLKYLYFEYLIPGSFEEDMTEQYTKINQLLHNH